MYKIIGFFLLLIILIPHAFAQVDINDRPNFKYSVQNYLGVKKNISKALTHLDLFFEELELNQVFLPEGLSVTKASLASIDRIYSGDLGNTVIFIKAGVVPNHKEMLEKSMPMLDGYLSHFQSSNGIWIAVFVKTKNSENAFDIFTRLKNNLNADKKVVRESFSPADLVMSKAYALDMVNCDRTQKVAEGNLDHLVNFGKSLAGESSPIQYITGCTMSAIKGAWDGSGGFVIGASKGVGEFITSPIESGKKYWESTTKLWDVTQKFFSDFEQESRKLYKSFDSLDPVVKTKLACQVIGTIGGGVLLNYLTAGVMASATTEAILLKIRTAISTALDSEKFNGLKISLKKKAVEIDFLDHELESNLFKISRGTPATSKADNAQILDSLKSIPFDPKSSKRKVGLSDADIQKLYRDVADHPVASLSYVNNYDKMNRGMGYCFGRATTAHIKALLNGADKSSVRKIWAVGDLETGTSSWRYHVATMVRNSKGEWIAIDPIMGKAIPVEKWYQEMKKYDSGKNMRIFDTEAKRFGPKTPSKYSPRELNNQVYENYFKDLMETFQDEAKDLAAKKKVAN